MNRHQVAQITDIPFGEGREFVVAGKIVAIFNLDGQFHAMDGICPHAGGPLAKGTVCGHVVTCPWHGWQFDVPTGQNCMNNYLKHPTFEIIVEGNALFVEMNE